MGTTFATKAARVLVAEEGRAVRQLLSDTLRSLGFLEITVVSSGRDVFNALEYNDCDWVIMPTFIRQPVSAFHALKAICEKPRLQRIRLSLFVDKEEERYLAPAFHYGLLSWHPKAYFQEHVSSELNKLLGLIKANNWATTLVAAEYFRNHMHSCSRFDSAIEVETCLLGLFPGSLALLLKHGETQLRSGRVKEGLGTLQQACLIDERAKKVTDAITEKYINVKISTSSLPPAQQNVLGVESCVLVDPDTAVLGAVKKLLLQAGVPRIETFDNGDLAWKWLSTNPEPGLILQEWRVPGVPG